MKNENNLGKFIREFEYDGVTFYVRGLTVGEYSDLAEQGLLRLTDRLFTEIAVCGIVGWDNFYEGGQEIVYGEPYTAEDIAGDGGGEDPLVEIGKYIYHHLTVLDEEDSEKFRGYIRFLYWSSKDENEGRVETFNCETCLNRGIALSRPCGKFDAEFIKDHIGLEEEQEQRLKQSKSKYSNTRLQKKKKAKIKRKLAKDNSPKGRGGVMMLNDFKYPECPISWIDEWIKVLGEVMYHAEKSELPLFDGGLMDQPYQIYRASKIVKSEYSKIENEELEEQRK